LPQKPIDVRPMQPHTLKWWKNRHSSIDVSPPYQRRGRLWSDTDKAYLIDSMLNGFDVPKLYMADFTFGDSPLNVKKLPYAIIDGKQRLEAIEDFFDGRIRLNDDFVLLENPALPLGGLSYKELQTNFPEIAERFEEYELLVMSVITKQEELVNELFIRLNRSKPLTGAEIRNAMKGPAPEVIRQIAKHEFFTTNIRFDVQRGEDLNVAAKVLSFEYHEALQPTKKTDLNAFVQQQLSTERLQLAGRAVLDVFTATTEIFLPKDRLLSSSGLVPVYFWFIRSRSEADYQHVREFLLRFESDRTRNRELVRTDPENLDIDQQLSEYDQYNRSTNDLRSHRQRVKILNLRFRRYLKQRTA
jgi:Protein of unknown function DUF262